MTDRRHILPPQTTPLERAVDQTMPVWDWMADAVTPAYIARDPAFTPWFAVDWQVAQFAVYFDTPQALLDAALPWLRVRGTAASVRAALGWVGWSGAVLDPDGAWLHLDLGRIIANGELIQIAHVVRASIPAHVRFYRVYHGYDARAARTDGEGRLDSGLLDDDSGVWVDVEPWGDPVKVSQGVRHGGVVAAPPMLGRAQAAHVLWHTSVAIYTDRMLLDSWRLDSAVLADTSGGHTVLHTGISNAPPRLAPLWPRPTPVHSACCAWRAPAPTGARTVLYAAQADRPNDDSRTWEGYWDDAPWQPGFPSRITFIQ